MARQSYRTRQADPEEPRYAPRGSGASSSMAPALVIVGVVVALAGAALFFSQNVRDAEDAAKEAAEQAAAANTGPVPFATLPDPPDEPFRKTWGRGVPKPGGGASAPIPGSLREHSDWEEATRLEAEALEFSIAAEALREEGDPGWRKPAREALDRLNAMLETTEPWLSVLATQVGTSDPGYRAFEKRREGWLERRAVLQKLL